jgi:geranylgeranyl diphosphate synthase type I
MPLDELIQLYRPAIEDSLRMAVAQIRDLPAELQIRLASQDEPLTPHAMLAYHMGWEGPGSGPEAQGKRIRPLLVLLTCAAAGGEWRAALPAASCVELLHNFSLIHDDIEDNSPLRRSRETLWRRWGVAQAINTGDMLFTLAHQTLLGLEQTLPAPLVLQSVRLVYQTCLALTQGQHLDIAYEAYRSLPLDAYWPMVTGKTAALLGACARLGALAAGADEAVQQAYQRFGAALGLAFQVQDDILGVWGDPQVTGKSTASDLLAGKKSLPVLYGLSLDGPFARRWLAGPLQPEEVAGLAAQLAAEGAREHAAQAADRLTGQALQALQQADPKGPAGEALRLLADRLLQRQV